MADDQPSLIELTADVANAYVSNNRIAAGDVATLITTIHQALSGLGVEQAIESPIKPAGAVSVRKSLASRDHIISMIDGKPYKALARHLTKHGHTPKSYRDAFGLSADYPMTAPSYSELRSNMARTLGLGRKPGQTMSKSKPKSAGRPKKAASPS